MRIFIRHKQSPWRAVAVLALVLAGCSKTLNESSAVTLSQSFVDAESGGIVKTSLMDLISQLDLQMPQPLHMPGLQRLMSKGWIEERKVMVAYPNFSGHFSGPWEGGVIYSFDLHTDQSSKPPRVLGSYEDCFPGGGACWGGTATGILQRQGPTTLTLAMVKRRPADIPDVKSLVASLTRGQPDSLSGEIRIGPSGSPFQATGKVSGPEVQEEEYMYVKSSSFPKDAFDSSFLKLGRLIVDNCTGLLLDSETVARANCAAHIKLTGEAEVFLPGVNSKGTAMATFRKQPDGGWVASGVTFQPPAYSLSQ